MVTGDGVVTMNERLGGRYAACATRSRPTRWRRSAPPPRMRRPDHKLADVRFLPVIPNPEKILCAGINYRSHAAETGRELPKQPSMFIRLADTLVGHDGEMIRPSVSDHFDFEGELALVIGQRRPAYPGRARARSCRRLHLLRRRQRARLPEILRHLGQEFPRHRPARALDRHHRRDPGSDPADPDHPAQRPGGAAVRHRPA